MKIFITYILRFRYACASLSSIPTPDWPQHLKCLISMLKSFYFIVSPFLRKENLAKWIGKDLRNKVGLEPSRYSNKVSLDRADVDQLTWLCFVDFFFSFLMKMKGWWDKDFNVFNSEIEFISSFFHSIWILILFLAIFPLLYGNLHPFGS